MRPILTAIEGGNPDDRFAQTSPTHLALVPPPITQPIVDAPPRSLPLMILDEAIALLERQRTKLEERRAVNDDRPVPNIGRGW